MPLNPATEHRTFEVVSLPSPGLDQPQWRYEVNARVGGMLLNMTVHTTHASMWAECCALRARGFVESKHQPSLKVVA